MLLGLALVALTPALEPPVVRKGYLSLADMVDASTLVCIGRVDKTVTIPLPAIQWDHSLLGTAPLDEVLVARIAVERVLKGDPGTKTVFHEAWSTWLCDTTRTANHERSVFFLAPGYIARAPEEIQLAASSVLGDLPVLRNVGSGDGLVAIRGEEGQEHVLCAGAPYALHQKEPQRTCRFDDFVRYVEEVVRFAPERLSVHARSAYIITDGQAPRSSFDLRILPDGSARLALEPGRQEKLLRAMFEPAAWRSLQGNLIVTLGHAQRRVGDFEDYSPARALTVRLPEASLEFAEGEAFDAARLVENQLGDFRAALRAWGFVRGALDCPECADHGAQDQHWLER